jgi:signal transduction histidine kinase
VTERRRLSKRKIYALSDPISPPNRIYFSKRLSTWGAHFFFLLTVVLTILSLIGWFRGLQAGLVALLAPLALYAAAGTLGWQRVLRRRSPQAVYRYFAAQFALIGVHLLLELALGVVGLATTMLGIGLMFQTAVLPNRVRVWLFGGLLLVTVTFYSLSMRAWLSDFDQIVLFTALFGVVYLVGLFLGLLIVREEQARETSLKLDESNRQLAQYAAEIESLSTIRERNRLAREIHDNLGHYLTAINMQLEVALMTQPQAETPTRASLLKAQSLTKEALSEIRRSITALRATPLENRALHEAIALLVEEHRAAGHPVEFRSVGTVRPSLPLADMTFYRIAQEGLTNIRKHAQSQSAEVVLDYREPQQVLLEVRDDGVGSEHADGGFGLLGMRERVELLGGTLAIETAKGQGFILRVTIPG